MKQLRKKIDQCDRSLLQTLAERFRTVKKVGLYKLKNDLPVLQKSRWAEVMEARLKQARQLHLNDDFVEKLFKLIHKESLKTQKALYRKSGKKS